MDAITPEEREYLEEQEKIEKELEKRDMQDVERTVSND